MVKHRSDEEMGNIEIHRNNAQAREDKEGKKLNHWHTQTASYQRGLEKGKTSNKEAECIFILQKQSIQVNNKRKLKGEVNQSRFLETL